MRPRHEIPRHCADLPGPIGYASPVKDIRPVIFQHISLLCCRPTHHHRHGFVALPNEARE